MGTDMHAIVLGRYLIRFIAVKVYLKINQLLVALADFQLKSSNLTRVVTFGNYQAILLLRNEQKDKKEG